MNSHSIDYRKAVILWQIELMTNTNLFIEGIPGNVAVLRYKDHMLTDSTTGVKKKINAISIDDAKIASEKYLKLAWKEWEYQLAKINKELSE